MTTAMELHDRLGLALSRSDTDTRDDYTRALAAVAATLDDEAVQAHAAWFDSDVNSGAEIAVHVRVLTAKGIITVDHEFSFDGYPDARFLPWSQVTQLNVIADGLQQTPRVRNAWVETTIGRIEFAGADSAERFVALVQATRRYLQ
jgi:hypothetical protein